MNSSYFQSLTSYLHDKGLLTDELKAALLEHDVGINSKPSVEITFGKDKGKTVSKISQFDKKYSWC